MFFSQYYQQLSHFQKRILQTLKGLVIFALLSLGASAFGASDSFFVRTLVDQDVLAPTIPTGLLATPISISQIDLSWDVSTDDSGTVSGYHVWRGAVLIGTTTSTTYSDTGLASSTSYTYSVSAFDSTFNESASSTDVVGTTLAPAPVEEEVESGSQYGSKLRDFDEMLVSLQVLPEKDSALIQFETGANIKAVVYWGRTVSYEKGSLAEQIFTLHHKTRIDELSPNTQYEYRIVGEDKFGRAGVIYSGVFSTLPPDDIFAPGNISELIAQKEGKDVVLSWVNPTEADFSKVRILRSDIFYPSDIADGWVVYEGAEMNFRDKGIFEGSSLYYTIFSYDALGNISSGAVVFVQGSSSTTTLPHDTGVKNDLNLSFGLFSFIQEGTTILSQESDQVTIDGAKQLTIRIPYEALPEHLKTVLVTIEDTRNNNRTFSFLLRANAEKTFYEGTLAPFGTRGDFPVTISVFDYTTSQIGYTHGVLAAEMRPIHTDSETTKAVGGFFSYMMSSGRQYFVWGSMLVLLLLLIGKRLSHV